MVGTALDGQLTSTVTSPRSRLRFAVATPAHDAAIRRLLRENPMRGAISISLEHEHDYFAGADIGVARDQTNVAFDDEQLRCMGRCTTRTAWINGKARRTGYLSELRLDASARGRFDLVRDGYRFFRSLQETNPADVYFTSIAADNQRARRLLERGLPGLPRYTHIGDLTTLLISTRRSLLESIKDALSSGEEPTASDSGCIQWSCGAPAAEFSRNAARAPRPQKDSHRVSASTDDLAQFLNAAGAQNNLAAAWTPATIASLARHDLPL